MDTMKNGLSEKKISIEHLFDKWSYIDFINE